MMLIAWHACSQVDIQKDSVVISKEIAKKVLIDLADYDRLIANKVEDNLYNCLEIQKEKDTLIGYISNQNKLYREQLLLKEKQQEIRENQLKTAITNKKRAYLTFGGIGLAAGLLISILFGC
jgi:hypothetical protein